MFKHILVPLDGSELAESALPAAKYLGGVFHARVILIHIIEPHASATVHGDRHLTEPKEAESYLDRICRQLLSSGVNAEYHIDTVKTSGVAGEIVIHQQELTPDLIIMCTHGPQDLWRLLFGSIAQKVVAAGNIPLLLIRPESSGIQKSFVCHTLLAPADRNRIHEPGLGVATDLAQATGAQLHLLSILPTFGRLKGRLATSSRFMPVTTTAFIKLAEEEFKIYLMQQASRLQALGITVSTAIHSGDAASVIAETAEKIDASMIVLGTHGKAGTRAFWNDSVGAKIQKLTQRPLLLVPVRKK
jgi:nucleotide-binding universal stress UspA family protein